MSVKRTGSLDQALNRLVSSKEQHVKVGILDNSKYPDGTSVATVAFWNEYGTSKIPPRPFFRNTIAEQKKEWVALAKDAIRMGYTIEHTLGLVGAKMQTDIQYSIMTFTTPKNAPYTVAMKGVNAPLRHTLLMHDSIKFEVMSD
jgi:hypothetical protein